jgi:hypothetical protein
VHNFCEIGFALAQIHSLGEILMRILERQSVTAGLCRSNQPESVAEEVVDRRGSSLTRIVAFIKRSRVFLVSDTDANLTALPSSRIRAICNIVRYSQ